jgi:hypothetical protein
MKRSSILPVILGSVLIIALILSSAFLFPTAVTFRPFGVNEVSQLLTLLALVSLFLERALEVFINTWRGPREEQLNNEIENNQRVIEDKRKLRETKIEQPQGMVKTTEVSGDPGKVTQEVAVQAIPAETDKLTAELNQELVRLKNNEQLRSAYKSETRKIALWTALLFGLLISGVGVRSLDTLVQPAQGSLYSGIQSLLFHFLDVLLTGGLIAGGSDGIHKITQLFSTYFEETRAGLRERSNSGSG